jgi:hypothetical protein
MPTRKQKVEITPNDIKAEIETASSKPDEKTLDENEYYSQKVVIEIQLEKLKTLRHHNAILEQNREERKKYARHIFSLTCIWAFLIFIFLFFVGFSLIKISDKVLITLITSTTVNFFGFFLLVVKYLFNTSDNWKKGSKKVKAKTVKKEA